MRNTCYSNFSFMCMFCRSLFVLLYIFFWPLCCLFVFDLRILIILLVSSNSSYMVLYNAIDEKKKFFSLLVILFVYSLYFPVLSQLLFGWMGGFDTLFKLSSSQKIFDITMTINKVYCSIIISYS